MEKLIEKTLENYLKEQKEPEWLKHYRMNNLEAYKALPLKKSQHTDLIELEKNLEVPSAKAEFEFSGSKEIVFMEFEEAIEKKPELIKNYLQKEKFFDERFELFGNAFFNCGYLIFVPEATDEKLEAEIKIKGKGKACIKSIIILNNQQNLTLMEEFLPAQDTKGAIVYNSSVFLNNASFLDEVELNNLDSEKILIYNKRNFVGRDSKLKTVAGLFGGKLTKSKITTHMTGQGAENIHAEIVFANGEQHFDQKLEVIHEVTDTQAKIDAKAVLTDKSSNIFDGMIKICKPAQRTNSSLDAHSILLSKEASSNNIPGLEIEANDVKATHAASVHKIDDEEIFYLMSRNIDEKEAERMIVMSFLETEINKAQNKKHRERLVKTLEEKYYVKH